MDRRVFRASAGAALAVGALVTGPFADAAQAEGITPIPIPGSYVSITPIPIPGSYVFITPIPIPGATPLPSVIVRPGGAVWPVSR